MAAPNFHDDVMDAALDKLATCTHVTVCSAEPANYAGIAAVTLAAQTVTAGDGNGDWTVADGDASGRKLTLAAQSGVSITASGDADFVVGDDGSTLLFVLAGDGQALTSGGTVDLAETDVDEIADPT